MRFFTPELYLQFNSADDEEADRAHEAWEKATRDYDRHIRDLRSRMPEPVWNSVKDLDELCLHDAELLGIKSLVTPFCPALAVVSLRQDAGGRALIYFLRSPIRECPPPEGWPFSAERRFWLYEELDAESDLPGAFVHRVLFSDGSVMEVPFESVVSHRFPMEARDAASSAVGTA